MMKEESKLRYQGMEKLSKCGLWVKTNIITIILFISIIAILFAPYLFTRTWSPISFMDTGQIGDTIGGVTAPIIGLVSIIFLYFTLHEQIKFNKKQKEIASDEQFKSTLFSLLQTQRDILQKISGKFTYLGRRIYEEKFQSENGVRFFTAARNQLELIFQALDYSTYSNNFNEEYASYEEEELWEQNYISSMNMPQVEVQANEDDLHSKMLPHRIAYINDKYEITKELYNEYQTLTPEKKVGFGYAIFFKRYGNVGYYFRHLYRILKFIKTNEIRKIESRGKKISSKEKESIIKQFYEYAQFIQAQMSNAELLLYFYNSFLFVKNQELIKKYDILENLRLQNLISPMHNCKPEFRLKDKKNLFMEMVRKDGLQNEKE